MPKRPRPSKERFYVYLRKEYTVIYSTSGPFKTISNDEGSNRQISGILNRGILTRFGTYEEALEHCKSNWSTIKTAYIPYIYFQDEYRHEESVCIEPENGIDTWENDTFSHEEHNENAFIDYLKTKTFSEDQKSTGFSPAHTAAQHGYINALIYLKGNDFNLNAQDKRGYTPLHYASLKVQKEAILFLLSQKVDCTLKTHNRQDVPMHERNAIASRLLMLQRYQTPIKRKEVEEISLYFPCVTHGGMIINLERDSDNILRIKNFDITNLNNTTPFYTFGDYAENPDYFDENGLKPGLQQRHIKSADSIKESFLKEWIGISIDDIITGKKCIPGDRPAESLPDIADALSHHLSSALSDPKNQFVGSALENKAFGWLIRRLKSFIKSEATNQYPEKLMIPETYKYIFLRHAAYKNLTFLYKTPSAYFSLNSFEKIEELFKIASYDDPNLAFKEAELSSDSIKNSLRHTFKYHDQREALLLEEEEERSLSLGYSGPSG